MNIGSLYQVKKYFWLLFPTKETAATDATSIAAAFGTTAAAASARGHVAVADAAASGTASACATANWSRHYKCEVTYFPLDSIVVFLEEDGELKRVLTADGKIGWTWFVESYNECFEEVKTKP
jgi:hypothetical protein